MHGLSNPFLNIDVTNAGVMLPLVAITGFLDGLNPCAFAVLLFFIAFLFTIRKTRASIWKMGLVYIAAIYLVYLGIGVGLLQTILITGQPHLMAKVGAWLVIVLGTINILNILIPKFPISLKIPQFSKKTLQTWMEKATLPAAAVLGVLVGLCVFPCSGGPYVATIGLLAARKTYLQGLLYLLIYNLAFILPLLLVLVLASNEFVVEKMTAWEQSKNKLLRLSLGLFMIALGVVILIFFV